MAASLLFPRSSHEIAAFSLNFRSTRSRYLLTTIMSQSSPDDATGKPRFVDIGANLLDERFTSGIYRGTFRHDPDLDLIMKRAADTGVKRIVVTAGTVEHSKTAVQEVRRWRELYPNLHFSCTVGVHPTRCKQEFVDSERTDEHILQELLDIALDGMKDETVVAIGEIGLDYDRLEFCPADVQKTYFVKQLQKLASATGLPLFLHNRSVGNDLYDLLSANREFWKSGGVVHSFDDSIELANEFTGQLGLYIGLNGCSLRTEENLQVARQLPLERILLETDCPYCEVRKTHAGHMHIKSKFEAKAEKKFERGKTVKSRQEPCHIVQIAEIVAGVKGIQVEEVADKCYDNSIRLFGWKNEV